MDLGRVDVQRSMHCEGIKELKVPVDVAKDVNKKNGLDEVYFNAGGKDYVAYGKGMSVDKLKASSITLEGKAAKVLDFNNEINSAGEGALKAPVKAAGFVLEGVGALAGAYGTIATYGVACGVGSGMASGAAIMMGGAFIGAGVVLGAGIAAGGGALYGALRHADYGSIDKVAK